MGLVVALKPGEAELSVRLLEHPSGREIARKGWGATLHLAFSSYFLKQSVQVIGPLRYRRSPHQSQSADSCINWGCGVIVRTGPVGRARQSLQRGAVVKMVVGQAVKHQ